MVGPVATMAYEQAVYSALTNRHSDTIQQNVEKKLMLARIRQDRVKFISQSFPKAVEIVARIVCSDKLRRVERTQAQNAERIIRDATRICMNLACNGHLGDDYKCLKCETRFCPKCEKRLDANHRCDEQDIQSLAVIRDMVQCPGCHLRVQKSTGCRNMTCVNCGENFDYYTGEKSQHGAHGNTNVTIVEKRRLSSIYMGTVSDDMMDLILQFEGMEPNDPSDAKILNIISRIPDDKDAAEASRPRIARKLSVALELKTRAQYYRQVYYRATAEIETITSSSAAPDVKLAKLRDIIRLIESAVPTQARTRMVPTVPMVPDPSPPPDPAVGGSDRRRKRRLSREDEPNDNKVRILSTSPVDTCNTSQPRRSARLRCVSAKATGTRPARSKDNAGQGPREGLGNVPSDIKKPPAEAAGGDDGDNGDNDDFRLESYNRQSDTEDRAELATVIDLPDWPNS